MLSEAARWAPGAPPAATSPWRNATNAVRSDASATRHQPMPPCGRRTPNALSVAREPRPRGVKDGSSGASVPRATTASRSRGPAPVLAMGAKVWGSGALKHRMRIAPRGARNALKRAKVNVPLRPPCSIGVPGRVARPSGTASWFSTRGASIVGALAKGQSSPRSGLLRTDERRSAALTAARASNKSGQCGGVGHAPSGPLTWGNVIVAEWRRNGNVSIDP